MSWPNKYFLHSCSCRLQQQRPWAPSQYTNRRLFVRSRKVSKPRDWYFRWSYRFEIWQAHRQHCCRSACQISEQSDNSEYKSRGFETLRDLTERRLFGYWDGALISGDGGLVGLKCQGGLEPPSIWLIDAFIWPVNGNCWYHQNWFNTGPRLNTKPPYQGIWAFPI